jgi:hypothetical protein
MMRHTESLLTLIDHSIVVCRCAWMISLCFTAMGIVVRTLVECLLSVSSPHENDIGDTLALSLGVVRE